MDEHQTACAFALCRKLRDEHLPGAKLSMGMSQDFIQAIECGADIVRIGSAIMGSRPGGNQ